MPGGCVPWGAQATAARQPGRVIGDQYGRALGGAAAPRQELSMRMNMQSPWFSGCLAAVIFAVIWLVTGGGLGGGLFLGSVLVGALATAIGFVVHGVMKTSRPRHGR
jgi:hypothetical protein